MKRLFLLAAALLLLTGCAGRTDPEQGIKVTVECPDVYSISCSTRYETCVEQNADNSVLTPGDSIYFDPLSEGKIHYTICAQGIGGGSIAEGEFTHDFSEGLIELLILSDGTIIQE